MSKSHEEKKQAKIKYQQETAGIDKWKEEEFKPEDNPNGMVSESSFSCLFPQYREKYIREIWPLIKNALKKYKIDVECDLVEGALTVKTTRQTWDPYSIIRARDFIKLLARSVPFPKAIKIMEDD